MSAATKPAVLVVDDERVVAWDLREMINALGCDCYALASSAEQALQAAELRPPDLVLMDIRLRGPIDGIETARRLQESYGQHVRVIFLSAHGRHDMGERADAVHAAAWLRKPVHAPVLREAVRDALADWLQPR